MEANFASPTAAYSNTVKPSDHEQVAWLTAEKCQNMNRSVEKRRMEKNEREEMEQCDAEKE